GEFDEPYATVMRRSTYPGREPDVMMLQRPNDLILPSGESGSDHSSPYTYDQHVPILIMGPGVRRAEDRNPYLMTRLAPTISALIAIPPPAAAYDEPLPLVDRIAH